MENVYQSEKERDRKENILKKSINYFDKGKVRLIVRIICIIVRIVLSCIYLYLSAS